MKFNFSERTVRGAAAALANARAGRRGAPPVSNILDVLQQMQVGGKASIYDDLMEDARAALAGAAEAIEAEHREAVEAGIHEDCAEVKP